MDKLKRLIAIIMQGLERILSRQGKKLDKARTEEALTKLVSTMMDRPENVEELQHIIDDVSKAFITGVSDESLRVIHQGMKQGRSIDRISQLLQKELNLARVRSNTIARTEVMRSYNVGSYLQAKNEDYMYFAVDNREGACELCLDEYEGQVFTMDQTDMLPPLHPNCSCIPNFFRSQEVADEWSGKNQDLNEIKREKIEEEGYVIPSDGTQPIKSE